jgi:hypothetical protein
MCESRSGVSSENANPPQPGLSSLGDGFVDFAAAETDVFQLAVIEEVQRGKRRLTLTVDDEGGNPSVHEPPETGRGEKDNSAQGLRRRLGRQGHGHYALATFGGDGTERRPWVHEIRFDG